MDPERAAIFASETMTAEEFDQLTGSGVAWLSVGASLLRSALVLLRQVEADHRFRLQRLDAGDIHGSMPAGLVLPSLMLAAMATEDALTAVAAVSKGISQGGKLTVRRQPGQEGPHDLEYWAKEAEVEGANTVEKDALREGNRFIEWIGCYPSPLSARRERPAVR
jgi:hypothetical protein